MGKEGSLHLIGQTAMKKSTTLTGGAMAEKEGFEPSIPFWGIHDFQSCALGQLRDFSKYKPTAFAVSLCIIPYLFYFVNPYFENY